MIALCLLVASSALQASVFQEGVRLAELGKWAEAREKFAAAAAASPGDAAAWKALGVSAGKLDDYAGAEEALHRACRLDAKLADACYYWARSLYVMNRFEEAVSALRQAMKVEGGRARLWTALGEAHEAAGRPREAEAAFVKAMSLPYDAQARLRYGVFLYRAGRVEEAAVPLEEAVKRDPRFPAAAAELGRVYYQLGRFSDAARELERAVALDPGQETARLLLGKVRRVQGTDK
ncbi:MAG: tetratricopeptide repeat protein [Bryobacteraceae bacterium]|nr:tetratricopeptide repeat protein [Bryobacteraceae bacterium]